MQEGPADSSWATWLGDRNPNLNPTFLLRPPMMTAVLLSVVGVAGPSSPPFGYSATPAFLSSRFIHTRHKYSPIFDSAGFVATLQKEVWKSEGTASPIAGAARLYYSRYAPSASRSVYIFGRNMHGFRGLHCVAAFLAHPARRDICS